MSTNTSGPGPGHPLSGGGSGQRSRHVDGLMPRDVHPDIFFAAVETTRMPMIVTDPHRDDNPIIFCNAAFERMTGYTIDEIVGTNCRFLQGPETDRATVTRVREAIAARRELAVELLNYRKDGSTFWNALYVSPVFDEAGELLYFFGSQLDISRRREAEEALLQAQKMEAVGRLTGGVAHDFNNILQVILGYVDVLETRVDPADRLSMRAVEAIGAAAARGATLTQHLLAFARRQELRDRLLNLHTLVVGLETLLQRKLGDTVALDLRFDPDLWNARLDPVQMEMALINLATNAREAMGGTGRLEITAANRVSSDAQPLADGLAPGEYVELTVTDQGPGIPAEMLRRVFDPFFSTKDVGQGSGLGLSMVYGFMRQSGGAVVAENCAGGGARFRLFFPRATGRVEDDAANLAHSAGRGEHVLLVEDDPAVGTLSQTTLEALGYRVTRVDGPRAALGRLAEGCDVQIVFSDVVMPGGMNGVTLARKIRARHPGLPVLLTSGYSDAALDPGADGFEVLRKPYRRAELALRLRTLLDGPNGTS